MNIYKALKEKTLENKKIVIYGTESFSEVFKNNMKNSGFSVSAFAVSNGHKNKDYLQGIPVFEINNLPYKSNECAIFNCVGERYKAEIENNLAKLGYIDYTYVSINDFNIYTKEIYKEFLATKNITIDMPIIKIGALQLNNFLLKNTDEPAKQSFIAEFGDLVFPPMLNEDNFAFEGPYEYGNVTLNNGDVVMDCGANFGLFSAVAAAKGCKSYAFEPFLQCMENLKFVCEKYMDSIVAINKAVSDKTGIAEFVISSNITASRLKLEDEETHNINTQIIDAVKVETTTIDDFTAKNNINKLDFIKADIEGEERNMLKGAKHTLKTLAPKLSLCTYHRADDKEVMEKLILDANPNYKILHKWKKLYAWVEK